MPSNNDTAMEIAGELYSLGVNLLQAGKIREVKIQVRKALSMASEYAYCLHLLGKHAEAISAQPTHRVRTLCSLRGILCCL